MHFTTPASAGWASRWRMDRLEPAWQRFLQVADTKKEVTDEDLRKIAVATG